MNEAIFKLAEARSDRQELVAIRSNPQFRRATTQMLLALQAAVKIIPLAETVDFHHRQSLLEKIGIVLGTNHGELETTKEFLRTLGETGLARPILFQNSLYNSTIGFLAQTLGIHGPTITTSHLDESGESALEIARLLLRQGELDLCLAVEVETDLPDLPLHLFPYPKRDGARAVLLSTEKGKGYDLRSLYSVDP